MSKFQQSTEPKNILLRQQQVAILRKQQLNLAYQACSGIKQPAVWKAWAERVWADRDRHRTKTLNNEAVTFARHQDRKAERRTKILICNETIQIKLSFRS